MRLYDPAEGSVIPTVMELEAKLRQREEWGG